MSHFFGSSIASFLCFRGPIMPRQPPRQVARVPVAQQLRQQWVKASAKYRAKHATSDVQTVLPSSHRQAGWRKRKLLQTSLPNLEDTPTPSDRSQRRAAADAAEVLLSLDPSSRRRLFGRSEVRAVLPSPPSPKKVQRIVVKCSCRKKFGRLGRVQWDAVRIKVGDFLRRPSISDVSPYKKDCVGKDKHPKHFLKMSVREAHKAFKAEFPEVKCSLASLYALIKQQIGRQDSDRHRNSGRQCLRPGHSELF